MAANGNTTLASHGLYTFIFYHPALSCVGGKAIQQSAHRLGLFNLS